MLSDMGHLCTKASCLSRSSAWRVLLVTMSLTTSGMSFHSLTVTASFRSWKCDTSSHTMGTWALRASLTAPDAEIHRCSGLRRKMRALYSDSRSISILAPSRPRTYVTSPPQASLPCETGTSLYRSMATPALSASSHSSSCLFSESQNPNEAMCRCFTILLPTPAHGLPAPVHWPLVERGMSLTPCSMKWASKRVWLCASELRTMMCAMRAMVW
mmetsp:Transcript_44439/g.111302  ORF Transcript_44439/g.111302 Transcript_44439/m.111302 type:complete len:214 (+) Transcript_44439:321-962(+)